MKILIDCPEEPVRASAMISQTSEALSRAAHMIPANQAGCKVSSRMASRLHSLVLGSPQPSPIGHVEQPCCQNSDGSTPSCED
eukprot:scaffold1199_cov265-Pinguiococcus_pyrenoidosus.AAC.5